MSTLSPEKERMLETEGNILAFGGPGCGKTYISLLKAESIINRGYLKKGQRVLFLSFARATIARVAQQAGSVISPLILSSLEINTYHGFIWNVLRSHGYLLANKSPIKLLPPPEAAALLSEISKENKQKENEKHRLFNEEGLLHFDLFADKCAELLKRSKSLAKIICDSYPVIILDEFQDTNDAEWEMIKALGQSSYLVALADPEQRIYEFRGASPNRIKEFTEKFTPTHFDFSDENHRSNGTDILTFGNDLLTEMNKKKSYKNVSVLTYQVRSGIDSHLDFKCTVLKRIQGLFKTKGDIWSLAILVPTKKLMLDISDYLESNQKAVNYNLPSITHDVSLDSEGPALAAILIASVLEGEISEKDFFDKIVLNLIEHIRGRKGNKGTSSAEKEIITSLNGYLTTGKIRGTKREAIVTGCWKIVENRKGLILSGDPGEDWLKVRKLFQESDSDLLKQVYSDAKFLRLLKKGTQLRSKLNELWRLQGNYIGAVEGIKNALLQEHFSTASKEWKGVNVMTIHKSKGKEFDEVIVYEGYYSDNIVRLNSTANEIIQARYALRVAVTRAMSHTTILTPKGKQCPFL